MTRYSACCAPIATDDDRKPAFVAYADYAALEADRNHWRERAEKAEQRTREVGAALIDIAMF